MRVFAFVLFFATSFTVAVIAKPQPSDQKAPENDPGRRVYVEGRPVDAILLPDGSIAYLMERPESPTPQDSESPWVLIAHPVRGATSTSIDPITGRRVAIGTDPDGTYHGFAWFVDSVPDLVDSEEGALTPVFETDPAHIEDWAAERTTPSQEIQGAAVQKWWAAWDEWLDTLRAGDLVEHSGIVASCRETEEGTVVTMKGDGTFQFLFRNSDRITYEGPQVSGPCDFVDQTVTVWTLPCDDGPCIRKIQAAGSSTESPKPPSVEAVSDAPVPHPGLIAGCRPSEGTTIVTVKGNGSFEFLYRSRDRVVYDGVQAGSPCELVGRNVVVWTIACDEDAPCISRVEGVAEP